MNPTPEDRKRAEAALPVHCVSPYRKPNRIQYRNLTNQREKLARQFAREREANKTQPNSGSPCQNTG